MYGSSENWRENVFNESQKNWTKQKTYTRNNDIADK